jgi:hypothetical protein
MKSLTFEEFLAGIFLKECFVADGAVQIVNHQPEDRVDLFFVVASVVR